MCMDKTLSNNCVELTNRSSRTHILRPHQDFFPQDRGAISVLSCLWGLNASNHVCLLWQCWSENLHFWKLFSKTHSEHIKFGYLAWEIIAYVSHCAESMWSWLLPVLLHKTQPFLIDSSARVTLIRLVFAPPSAKLKIVSGILYSCPRANEKHGNFFESAILWTFFCRLLFFKSIAGRNINWSMDDNASGLSQTSHQSTQKVWYTSY